MKKVHRQTVATPSAGRKPRFRAALSLAGLTASAWADREGITESYLSMILSGTRANPEIEQKIAAFTEKYLRSVA